MGTHLYHKANIALIGLGPLALLLSPSSLNFPVDLALGVIIPVHSHLGAPPLLIARALGRLPRPCQRLLTLDRGWTACHDVLSDYGKKITKSKAFDSLVRKGIFGMTVITFLGLTKLNLEVRSSSFSEICRARWWLHGYVADC